MSQNVIAPQEGFQTQFLSSPADIVIGGSGAGVGKTYALLMDAARYSELPGYTAAIFRRTTVQVKNPGGLWDTSMGVFAPLGATPVESIASWNFDAGGRLKFGHLEHEKNKLDWQGSQIAYLGFDELTHFSETQFFYMLSRNRSTCGMRPCVRATCNPDADSWVAEFIEWWIEQDPKSPDYGFPIKDRIGVLRYFIRDGENMVWGDTKDEVKEKCPHIFNNVDIGDIDTDNLIKSLTMIPGSIYDNMELLKADPGYLGNLMALEDNERRQLLDGNWKIKVNGNQLADPIKIQDVFTNKLTDEQKQGRYITCDAARQGDDLAVIKTWKGFQCVRIDIFTKCHLTIDDAATNRKLPTLEQEIEDRRQEFQVPKSQALIDQDGMGGGLIDRGYLGFVNNSSPLPDPKTKIKDNCANLKTQMYYRFLEGRVNKNAVSYEGVEIYVDGVKTTKVKIKGKVLDVREMLKREFSAVRKTKVDNDSAKKAINSKQEQKNILKRSPDLGDTSMMREWLEMRPSAELEWIEM